MRGIEKSGKASSLTSVRGRVTVVSGRVNLPVGLSWPSVTVPMEADTAPSTITMHLSTCKTIFNMARDSEAYSSFSIPSRGVPPDGLGGRYYRPAGQSILLASGKVKNAKCDCRRRENCSAILLARITCSPFSTCPVQGEEIASDRKMVELARKPTRPSQTGKPSCNLSRERN